MGAGSAARAVVSRPGPAPRLGTPDVVVLNMRVGPEDGLGVLRRLKAMKAGAADVVTKPINTEQLIQSVLDSLARGAGAVPNDRENPSR